MSHTQTYMAETYAIANSLCSTSAGIESMVAELVKLRERRGRLFFIGLGGSAANCSHAVNDFRKLCGIEAYAPTDNVAELTARANDEGFETIFDRLFLKKNDALFVLSVGGGSLHGEEDQVSVAISSAVRDAADEIRIFGIVGRPKGATQLHGSNIIVIPTVEPSRVTPHTEAFQSVILHCIVSHPDLQIAATKW